MLSPDSLSVNKVSKLHLNFEKELAVYVVITHLGKITINVGNHQKIVFHSESLDLSHFCCANPLDIFIKKINC